MASRFNYTARRGILVSSRPQLVDVARSRIRPGVLTPIFFFRPCVPPSSLSLSLSLTLSLYFCSNNQVRLRENEFLRSRRIMKLLSNPPGPLDEVISQKKFLFRRSRVNYREISYYTAGTKRERWTIQAERGRERPKRCMPFIIYVQRVQFQQH